MILKLFVPAVVIATFSLASALTAASPIGRLDSRSQLDAILGTASVTENFEAFEVPTNNELGYFNFFGPLTSNSVIQGQGPGLVVSGISIRTNSQLQWYNTAALGGNSKRLGFTSGQAYLIDFSTPVSAFGFDFTAVPTTSGSSSMYVYDTKGDTVGQFQYALVNNPLVPTFAGFSHPDGISGVEIFTFQGGPILDNFTFGRVPEPSALILATVGSVIVLSSRRRKSLSD